MEAIGLCCRTEKQNKLSRSAAIEKLALVGLKKL